MIGRSGVNKTNFKSNKRTGLVFMATIVTGIGLGGIALANDVGADVTVDMHAVTKDGVSQVIGQIHIREQADGLVLEPDLNGLAPGLHGFHIHENPDCGVERSEGELVAAGKAGGHFAGNNEDSHGAPWAQQHHTGDLPTLYFDSQQSASHPVFKPDLTLDAIRGHALIIHQGGDNYSDIPKPLGGGGERMACGVIAQ